VLRPPGAAESIEAAGGRPGDAADPEAQPPVAESIEPLGDVADPEVQPAPVSPPPFFWGGLTAAGEQAARPARPSSTGTSGRSVSALNRLAEDALSASRRMTGSTARIRVKLAAIGGSNGNRGAEPVVPSISNDAAIQCVASMAALACTRYFMPLPTRPAGWPRAQATGGLRELLEDEGAVLRITVVEALRDATDFGQVWATVAVVARIFAAIVESDANLHLDGYTGQQLLDLLTTTENWFHVDEAERATMISDGDELGILDARFNEGVFGAELLNLRAGQNLHRAGPGAPRPSVTELLNRTKSLAGRALAASGLWASSLLGVQQETLHQMLFAGASASPTLRYRGPQVAPPDGEWKASEGHPGIRLSPITPRNMALFVTAALVAPHGEVIKPPPTRLIPGAAADQPEPPAAQPEPPAPAAAIRLPAPATPDLDYDAVRAGVEGRERASEPPAPTGLRSSPRPGPPPGAALGVPRLEPR